MFKIFIYTFNVANQRLRRYTSGTIFADSYEKTIFKFNFNTPDWDLVPVKIAVFSCCGENYQEPLDESNMCKVPAEVLHAGYFSVSVYGNTVPTNSVRVPVVSQKGATPVIPGGNGGQGKIYVPEVTPDNMLVFKLQDKATEERLEFDIDKSNDWDEMDDTTGSNYVWEPMA